MRSTLACERKAKTKCIHDGQSPCQACKKKGTTGSCVLSRPFKRSIKSKSHSSILQEPQNVHPFTLASGGQSNLFARPGTNHSPDQQFLSPHERPPEVTPIARLVSEISINIWTKALSIFRKQFPEYGLIHPAELEWTGSEISGHYRLKLMGIMAVTSRYFNYFNSRFSPTHAKVVIDEVKRCLTEPPTFTLVQAYQVIALWKWGEGHLYDAWMYIGVAIRMVQTLLPYKDDTSNSDPETLEGGMSRLTETECRTVWACFVLERLLSCGKRRPAVMKLEEVDIPLPLNDSDFAFDRKSNAPVAFQTLMTSNNDGWSPISFSEQQDPHPMRMIILGVTIWSDIHGWVAMGGRKQRGMIKPENSPWRSGSKWALLREKLEIWRHSQHSRFRYPEANVSTHIYMGQAEAFVYLNLIYYLSIIFLRREFIPFLPVIEKHPRGPIDVPLFEDAAPEGWWNESSRELFHAVQQISDLMRAMHDHDISFYTPFTGLCTFTAALMNIYAAKFPAINCCETLTPEKLAGENISDLNRFCELWEMGKGLLDTVSVVRDLYSKVTQQQDRLGAHSRDHYVQLETTINFAQTQELSSPNQVPPTSPMPSSSWAQEVEQSSHQWQQDAATPRQPASDTNTLDPLSSTLSAEVPIIDEDVWRLWTYYEEPYLLNCMQ